MDDKKINELSGKLYIELFGKGDEGKPIYKDNIQIIEGFLKEAWGDGWKTGA